MRTHELLPAILRALAGRYPAWPRGGATADELDWLVASGLGPMTWRMVSHLQLEVPGPWRERLRSVDLVARLETRELSRNVEWVLRLVRRAGCESTLLKGISVARRYYPEPHLRIMGDVDLLIPKDGIDPAMRVLRNEGFVLSTFAEPEWWDTLHHAPPLIHRERGLTVELHHALLPPSAPARNDPPFDLATLCDRAAPGALGGEAVRLLAPELELALLAAAWSNDLSTFLGSPGLQRPLVDAVMLLTVAGDGFDWHRLERWTAGTVTGACVWTLLSTLHRYGALPCAPEVLDLFRQRRRVGPASARVVQHVVHRHVVTPGLFGRILTASNTANVLRTLLNRGPAWRRWLLLPVNLAFSSNERRFRLGFQLGRLRSLLRRQ